MDELEQDFLLNEPEAEDETAGDESDESEDEGVEETPEEEGI